MHIAVGDMDSYYNEVFFKTHNKLFPNNSLLKPLHRNLKLRQ
jgi:hypothetical protein